MPFYTRFNNDFSLNTRLNMYENTAQYIQIIYLLSIIILIVILYKT